MKRSRFLRDWKLIKQIGILFFAFMFVASIINIVFVYKNSMEMLFKEKADATRKLAQNVATEMQQSSTFPSLISYWQEHYTEMELGYNNDALLIKKIKEFNARNPGVDIYLIDSHDLQKLSDYDKKLFAEAQYLLWTNTFVRLKNIYNFAFLSCYRPIPDEKIFYFLNAVGDEELKKGRSVFMLGTEFPSVRATHPVSTRTWETGLMQNDYDVSTNGYYHIYIPVNDLAGKPICLVDAQLEVNSLHKELLHKIAKIEILSILGFLLCAIVLFVLLRAIVIKPVANLQSAMNQYQIDKDYKKAAERLKKYFGQNEMGLLSFDFSSLVMEIHDYTENIAKLAAEKERIATELSIATTIQTSTLPQIFPAFPDRKEFDIYATMTPAKEVGGDFYDFFMVDDDHIALVIADVSGKGVPAALFMMASKTVIKAQVLAGSGAAETLRIVNNTLSQNNAAEMFVSVWLGIYEISTDVMRCANAGHEYPAIKKADGNFELFKDKHDFVLGGMSGIKYTEYELKLGTGDIVFVYTDGVPEATDSSSALFGTDRMIDALNSNKEGNLKILLDNVRNHVDKFVGEAEQFDDLTMLAFKIT